MHARVSFYEVASGGDTAAGVKGFEDAMRCFKWKATEG